MFKKIKIKINKRRWQSYLSIMCENIMKQDILLIVMIRISVVFFNIN